jgi:hypothetical protein
LSAQSPNPTIGGSHFHAKMGPYFMKGYLDLPPQDKPGNDLCGIRILIGAKQCLWLEPTVRITNEHEARWQLVELPNDTKEPFLSYLPPLALRLHTMPQSASANRFASVG